MDFHKAIMAAAVLAISGIAQAQTASPATPPGTIDNGVAPPADARGDRSTTTRDPVTGAPTGSAAGASPPVGSPQAGPGTTLGTRPGATGTRTPAISTTLPPPSAPPPR